MDYVELNVRVTDPELAEILTAELAELPYESFQTEGEVLKAYIPRERLADCMQQTDDLLARYGIADRRYIAIESQNWNALWEQNFTPVDVDGRILIRAPFHAPQQGYELEVVVMPRMAFGSGHHATTCLVASALCDLPLEGKRGLDMGCGTGVLAIVAAKRAYAPHILTENLYIIPFCGLYNHSRHFRLYFMWSCQNPVNACHQSQTDNACNCSFSPQF